MSGVYLSEEVGILQDGLGPNDHLNDPVELIYQFWYNVRKKETSVLLSTRAWVSGILMLRYRFGESLELELGNTAASPARSSCWKLRD